MKLTPLSDFQPIAGAALADRIEATRSWPKTTLFGLPLVLAKREEIARHIMARAGIQEKSVINFVNAHCINQQASDPEYRDVLLNSSLLLPDGVGMEIAAGLASTRLAENLNGTDLFPAICREAQEEGVGIFLLGGLPGVADATAAWAVTNYPELRIAGTNSGFFGADTEAALIERINRSRAGILLVGFGVPLQEKWIARNRHRLNVPVLMGVGGLFDYYSSRIPRAPKFIRACKSEWMWRLAMEPRRMAKRYIVGNALFLARAALEGLKARRIVSRANSAGKRLIDILGAATAITLLLPILLATALAIRLEDKGPVLFRQTRIGKDGAPFDMIKFRSMYIDAEARRDALLSQSERDGTCFKMRDDPRITRSGRFIRRFSIDELPQLFNVLSGAMSLVGPRPALISEVSTYRGSHWKRLAGKPGITCTWQVRGRADIPFERQAIMDRAYLKRANLWIDLVLLLCTPGAVISGRGAY